MPNEDISDDSNKRQEKNNEGEGTKPPKLINLKAGPWEERRSRDLVQNLKPFTVMSIPAVAPRDENGRFKNWYRQNGNMELAILVHEKYGAPEGKDRYLLDFIFTEVKRTASPIIYFKNDADLLKAMDLKIYGENYDWLRGAIKRCISSSFRFFKMGVSSTQIEALNILSEVNLSTQPNGQAEGDCYLMISKDLYEQIMDPDNMDIRTVPMDRFILKKLYEKKMWAFSDFVRWVSWRNEVMFLRDEKEVFIDLKDFKSQLCISESMTDRKLKHVIKTYIQKFDQFLKEFYGDEYHFEVELPQTRKQFDQKTGRIENRSFIILKKSVFPWSLSSISPENNPVTKILEKAMPFVADKNFEVLRVLAQRKLAPVTDRLLEYEKKRPKNYTFPNIEELVNEFLGS